jgi:hypothetical protein
MRPWFVNLICGGYVGACLASIVLVRITDGDWPRPEYWLFVMVLVLPTTVAWVHYVFLYRLELTPGWLLQRRLFGLANKRLPVNPATEARLDFGGYTNDLLRFIIRHQRTTIELQFNMYLVSDLKLLVYHLHEAGARLDPRLIEATGARAGAINIAGP